VLVVPHHRGVQRGGHAQKLLLEPGHLAILNQLARLNGIQLRRLAWVAGSVACVLLGTAGGMAWRYFTVVGRATENTQLREENLKLKEQLSTIRERVSHINDTLARVKHLNSSLQNITQLKEPQPKVAVAAAEEDANDDDPREDVDPAALSQNLDKLSAEAQSQEDTLKALTGYFEDQKAVLASAPSIWPVRGWVTSDFGFRLDPYTAERRLHAGIDIANAPGTNVIAPADGTVVYAATESGYGNILVLDHGSGIKTRYGHLSRISVHLGDRVTRGQVVAQVGSSGRSTGPHLHYEVRINGEPENPRKFILDADEPADAIDGYLSAGPGGARSAMGGGD
jgi:murein DD-endopeptidase MepM/ murein hydrolase activator NlpD